MLLRVLRVSSDSPPTPLIDFSRVAAFAASGGVKILIYPAKFPSSANEKQDAALNGI